MTLDGRLKKMAPSSTKCLPQAASDCVAKSLGGTEKREKARKKTSAQHGVEMLGSV